MRTLAVAILIALTARAYADPEIVELHKQNAIAVTVRATPDALGDELAKAFVTLLATAQKQGLDIAGPPFARYLSRTGTFAVEAGLPTTTPPGRMKGKVHALVLPAGRVAMLVYKGPHDKLPAAHAELDRWLAATKHVEAGARWEVYVTNPFVEPDPAKQETRIIAPLR